MTAILGYIQRNNETSLGVLCADDLEGGKMQKVDKMSKVSDRFAIATCGEGLVDSIIDQIISYFDQYNGSKKPINSILEFSTLLNEVIPHSFNEFKKAGMFKASQNQGQGAFIVILDNFNNELFYIELGRNIWKDVENKEYAVAVTKLKDGFYRFGYGTQNQIIFEDYKELDEQKVLVTLNNKMLDIKKSFPDKVGDIGSIQINYLGEIKRSSFTSVHKSWKDVLECFIIANS